MNQCNTKLVLTIMSLAIGIAGMYFLSWLQIHKLYTQAEWTPYYYWVVLPVFAVFSFAFGFIEPVAPWRWPLLMVYVNYFSGFWIMEYFSQFPPLEIILVAVIVVPMIILGYLGKYAKIRKVKGVGAA